MSSLTSSPIVVDSHSDEGSMNCGLPPSSMSLDGIDMEDDEQDMQFSKYSVDTVYLSYLAARNRVRQYTQLELLALLKREEAAWLQRVEKSKEVLPGYKPQPEGVVITLQI
ncbi:hypothetical protein P692DRAFT_20825369 [Suillus brevipes Sb2]|nr:hypothetical protein P692DRAFT_20825369 [Suillus brevipes Sb2]